MRNNQGVTQIAARSAGRPPVTSHGEIEQIAFELFDRFGFAQTTTEQIADAVGIGRRTLFRYFPTKNDIPWGRFSDSLAELRAQLAATDPDIPLSAAITDAVVKFNAFDEAQITQHVRRMRMILQTPELQAHATLKYAQWRSVIAEFVARRLNVQINSPQPTIAGHAALAMALAAYEQWLLDPTAALPDLIRTASGDLRRLWTT